MSKRTTDPIVRLLSVLCPMIYFASYLTRKNYGIVMEAVISSEGVTNAQAGLVETLALISYGAGQIISGILGDKFKPQNVILCGLSATTVCNLLMPFAPDMTFRAVIWFINGFAQSMLWPPLVRIMAAYMDKQSYDDTCVNTNIAGISGTICLYLTSSLVWLKFFGETGWKYTFFSSALICLVILILWLLGFRKIRAGGSSAEVKAAAEGKQDLSNKPKLTVRRVAAAGFPFIALAIIMQGMLRDGVTDWVPTFIRNTFRIASEHSILMAVILPVIGVVSLKVIGVINRKFVKDEVKSAGSTFIVALACCAFLALFYQKNQWVTLGVSALVVGTMHAINFFLICVVPVRFEKYGMVSTMSGLINSLTYVGSAAALYGFGAISDKWGWNACVTSWVVIAALGTALCFIGVKPWKKFREADV